MEDVRPVLVKVAACEGFLFGVPVCDRSGAANSRGAPACLFCLVRTFCNGWRFLQGRCGAREALW